MVPTKLQVATSHARVAKEFVVIHQVQAVLARRVVIVAPVQVANGAVVLAQVQAAKGAVVLAQLQALLRKRAAVLARLIVLFAIFQALTDLISSITSSKF